VGVKIVWCSRSDDWVSSKVSSSPVVKWYVSASLIIELWNAVKSETVVDDVFFMTFLLA
jgi:hypothetical protein